MRVLTARYAGFERLLKGIYINIYLTKGCTKGITLWKTIQVLRFSILGRVEFEMSLGTGNDHHPNFEIFDSWQSG